MLNPEEKNKPSVLVIDDDHDSCLLLSRFLIRNNYKVECAPTGNKALKRLRASHYDLVVCKYKLPDQTGEEFLQRIRIINSTVAIIIVADNSDIEAAAKLFRYGASGYITKPFYPDELLVTIGETISNNQLKHALKANHVRVKNNGRMAVPEEVPSTLHFIVGKSASSQSVQRAIELIAPSDMSVIISGETGTGKEFVAQSIHKFSKRSSAPFMAIDCGALPKELAGSELFGHTKGSFTGAIADKAGCFELADGGTIFLDEIGNLSYENQIKLLRVLQEHKIKRIGAIRDNIIDVRIITATNENVSKVVRDGTLREDLYYRLNEFKIQLLPLRERKEDIMFFAEFFLQRANYALHKNVQTFSPEVEHCMTNYHWHGNLRELNNVVKRSVLLTTDECIQMDSLPQEILQPSPLHVETNGMGEHVGKLKSIAWTAERQAIIDVLERVNFNKSKASQILNIDRKTLYNKLKLYTIMV